MAAEFRMKPGAKPITLPISRLICEIEATGSVAEACRRVGIVWKTLRRRVQGDAELKTRIDNARRIGREAAFPHGSPGSCKRCRCDLCRFTSAEYSLAFRPGKTRVHCPGCARWIGTRGGLRLAHYAAPGVVCPESQMSNGPIRLGGAS